MSNSSDTLQTTSQPEFPVTPQAMALHKNFLNSVSGLKRELVRIIFYLTAINDRKVYRMLGYRSIVDYAEHTAGLSETQCRSFIKIGKKLEKLPLMREAMEKGLLSWRKANLVIGVADPENEAELVDAALNLSEPKLRSHLRDRNHPPAADDSSSPESEKNPAPGPKETEPANQDLQGDPATEKTDFSEDSKKTEGVVIHPETPPSPHAETLKSSKEILPVLFNFTPEEYALWQSTTSREAGGSKEQKLIAVLTGNSRHGKSGYLIILQECPTCGRAKHQTSRGTFEAPKALLETAQCDGTVEDENLRRKRIIPPKLKKAILRRDGYKCQAPGCQNSHFLQIHHRVPASQGGLTVEENLITLCSRCHRQLHEDEEAMRKLNSGPAV